MKTLRLKHQRFIQWDFLMEVPDNINTREITDSFDRGNLMIESKYNKINGMSISANKMIIYAATDEYDTVVVALFKDDVHIIQYNLDVSIDYLKLMGSGDVVITKRPLYQNLSKEDVKKVFPLWKVEIEDKVSYKHMDNYTMANILVRENPEEDFRTVYKMRVDNILGVGGHNLMIKLNKLKNDYEYIFRFRNNDIASFEYNDKLYKLTGYSGTQQVIHGTLIYPERHVDDFEENDISVDLLKAVYVGSIKINEAVYINGHVFLNNELIWSVDNTHKLPEDYIKNNGGIIYDEDIKFTIDTISPKAKAFMQAYYPNCKDYRTAQYTASF